MVSHGVAQEIKLTGVIRFKNFSCFYLSRLFEPHEEMEMGLNYPKAKKNRVFEKSVLYILLAV